MPLAQDSQNDKITVTEKLNDFLQQHRSKFLAALISIMVIIAGIITVTAIRDKIREKALIEADSFALRYEALKNFISEGNPDADSRQGEIDALLNDLSSFASKTSGFASSRAYIIIADINYTKKNWAEAESAYIASAEKAPKSYLAPLSYYNAASAAEEQGKTQDAINLYTKALNYENEFPAAIRAQFAVGRLEEYRNNPEAALTAYRTLVGKWPSDPIYVNLAQSRIIVLSDLASP